MNEFDAGPKKNLDVSGYIFGHDTITNKHQFAADLKGIQKMCIVVIGL